LGAAGTLQWVRRISAIRGFLLDSQGSISIWIGHLKAGNNKAAGPLWHAYFARLVSVARRKLGDSPRAAADEEDVALSAFNSFCRRALAGRFPDLTDRHDLWRILLMLTLRKVINLKRAEARIKRGSGRVRHASALAADGDKDAFIQIMGHEPTPELAAMAADECRRLLGALGHQALQAIAIAKMEGYTNAEIAQRRGVSIATVERKLQLIRKTWQREEEV
jgi:DNA-directed RNA polymerase specialized sigma24 family protein